MLITQIWKNEAGTGLSNVVSYLYSTQTPNEKVTIEFNTAEGIKSLTLYWKVVTTPTTKKWYAYIVPKIISSTNKDEEYFTTKQDLFLPAVTNTLFQLGFKDSTASFVKDSRDSTTVKDLFTASTPTSFDPVDNFNFDDLNKKIEAKKEWKLGVLEVLHKLFNTAGQTVAWPSEIEYKTMTESKKTVYPEKVKKVYLYKKLMGSTMIDSPIQILTGLTISTSTFNVVADGIQPLVIEGTDGKLVEAKQFRKKILVSNGRVRVPFLYSTLTQEIFNELVENGVIKDETYMRDKYYKIVLDWQTSGEQLSLVNKKVLQIPQEEIVNLVNDIEVLKVRQSVYNAKIKELNGLTGVFQEFVKPDYEKDLEGYGVDSKGIFNVTKEEDDTPKIKDSHIVNNINISVLKFPETEVTKTEKEILNKYLDIKADTGVDKLLAKKEDLIKKLEGIKNALSEKRYKLSLISNTFFLNWFSDSLSYDVWADWKVDVSEKTTAAWVVGGVKNARVISSKDGKIKVRIQLFQKEEIS